MTVINILGSEGFETFVFPNGDIGVRPKWISVKDRLPELKSEYDGKWLESDFVLAYHESLDTHMAAPTPWILYMYKASGQEPKWSFIGENCPGEVTHWMILPEPPKDIDP